MPLSLYDHDVVEGGDIGFSPVGLRQGAVEHDTARAAAETLATALSAIAIDRAALGDVPGVRDFVAAALSARDAWEGPVQGAPEQ